MDNPFSESIEKIRQQFDRAPYPKIPLDKTPKNELNFLYIHNLVTPYYLRNQKVIETEGKVILDAGCGSGYKALALAEANPGAKIVGVDLSKQSTDLATKRLQYHGYENAEFHPISIEDLPSLDLEFDYINCDEVLYLIPDPIAGLQAMKSVLKPDGILRVNLHSSLQRATYYRAQSAFKLMGLMDESPGDMQIELVQEIMVALKDTILLKNATWKNVGKNEERILANYLLQGDKGYTIPEVFAALSKTDLEFICMVNWREWQLLDLFKNPDDLPAFLSMSLPGTTIEEQLHLFELLHPVHRLLDFWCGHPSEARSFLPVSEWDLSDWQGTKVHLHPQLRTAAFKQRLIACLSELTPFNLSQILQTKQGTTVLVDRAMAECLFPLLEKGVQPFASLVNRWQQLHPVHPVTLEPTTDTEAAQNLQKVLAQLEELGIILLEPLA